MKQAKKMPTNSNNINPKDWKSIVVYVAAIASVIDIPVQAMVLQEFWTTVTSVLLALFLCAESYVRLRRHAIYLGPVFAPALSIVLLVMIAVTYVTRL